MEVLLANVQHNMTATITAQRTPYIPQYFTQKLYATGYLTVSSPVYTMLANRVFRGCLQQWAAIDGSMREHSVCCQLIVDCRMLLSRYAYVGFAVEAFS